MSNKDLRALLRVGLFVFSMMMFANDHVLIGIVTLIYISEI
jgi:hypothetical protein